jgi:general secretion pathway protein G
MAHSRIAAGFTLIELLVVMTLIALLLTMAVPRYFVSVEKSKQTVLRQNLSTMRDAIDKFYADNGRYPESLDTLAARRYLRGIPQDPITGSVGTWIVIAPPADSAVRDGVYDVRSGAEGAAIDGTPYGQL